MKTSPESGLANTGVAAFTVPTFEPAGHLAGSFVKVASGQASDNVDKRALNCRGSVTAVEAMLASPAFWVSVTVKPVGCPAVAAVVVALISGANGSLSQPVAPVGVVAVLVAVSPAHDWTVSFVVWGPRQPVGRRMKNVFGPPPPFWFA